MRGAVLLAILSACGRVSFDAPDASFDASSIDAARCIAPAGDNDDDGDGVTDACDTCPQVAGAQLDSDGDGVGDACDPFASPTETLAKFEPFLDALGPDWTSNRADLLAIKNSMLAVSATNVTAWVGYKDEPTNNEFTMRGRFDSIGTSTGYQLSIQFGNEVLPGAEYCEAYGAPMTQFKLTRSDGAGGFATLDAVDIPQLAAGPFTMRFGHSPSGFHCVLTMNGTTYEIASPETFAIPREVVTLQFIDLDASVESLAQVETTP